MTRAARGGPQRQQPFPRMAQQPGGPQNRRGWKMPGGGRGPNANRRLLLGAGVLGGGALLLNWIFGEEEYDLEEEAWSAIQRGDLGNFYEGVDEQGRRFVVDAEANIGYETLDPMAKPNADSLDGYVVTADGSFFYEKYNEKTEQIDRTKIGDCKRQLKNSGLPLYDLECNISGETFKSTMNDLRRVDSPTFGSQQQE
ncbi:hypothetical protein HKI87_07g46390 [Chloropicon roscoffensis]|uniref:Uncharacterized protein n=1 Tax=Chloropicon roscoffensis TaxID=1461544 RepID=A0AAX4PBH4_9CHLO